MRLLPEPLAIDASECEIHEWVRDAFQFGDCWAKILHFHPDDRAVAEMAAAQTATSIPFARLVPNGERGKLAVSEPGVDR